MVYTFAGLLNVSVENVSFPGDVFTWGAILFKLFQDLAYILFVPFDSPGESVVNFKGLRPRKMQ